jgi:3-phenylpropionate/trans-cinnamate dioxygenase ferredoxin reductase subunit
MTEHVVVVGAGHAGIQVADSLRAHGFGGAVTVLGEETAFPYQRPPLSKDHLADGAAAAPLPLRGERFFADNRVDLRTGARAIAVDRARRAVTLDDATVLTYTALVLATGAQTRTLPVPGTERAGVHELRTLADAERLRHALTAARSAVVVGAGFIGLEFAAVARKRGLDVTVLEAGARPMARAISPEMSDHLAGAHRRMGTDLRVGESLAAITGSNGSVVSAVTARGAEYPADLLVMAVGVLPRDELARGAGLAVDDGIVVDEQLRTTDPAVYAVGDCVRGGLESVQNATDQARHVAEMILGGATAYSAVPWFWSNQGSLRLQIAGRSRPGDATVVCGDVAGGRFSVLCFRERRLEAVESLNRPADHIAARRMLAAGEAPSQEQAAEPDFSLKAHAAQLARTDALEPR